MPARGMRERNAIFREAALERLSSPERVDALIEVVTPGAWLAWVPLAGIAVAALVWGIFGTVNTTVSGRAILLPHGGLAEVSAAAPGRIIRVLVNVGERIERGQAIARFAPPEVDEQRQSGDRLPEEAGRATAVVESPYAGRVVDVKVGPGMLVTMGTSLVTVEPDDGIEAGLDAAIYVAASDGKKIQPGMTVRLAPTTVRREEFGYLIATITYVSDYPATMQSMRLRLQNEELAREFSGTAPPIEILARLLPANNFSGYRWSTATGPRVKVTAGTLAQAEVVVRRQAPITLVIPALRETLGVR